MIERKTLRHEIKEYLLDAIMNGELKPGERIVETRLAKEMQVSQAPVREAIRELEQMNLIETVAHQGAFVKKLSKEEVAEAYVIREALEGLAASQAAEIITVEDIEILTNLIAEMELLALKGNVADFSECDSRFHEKIFEISNNKLLFKTYTMVKMNNLFVVGTKLSKKDLLELALRHKDIVAAFSMKDKEKAEQSARLHIQEISNEVLKNLE